MIMIINVNGQFNFVNFFLIGMIKKSKGGNMRRIRSQPGSCKYASSMKVQKSCIKNIGDAHLMPDSLNRVGVCADGVVWQKS